MQWYTAAIECVLCSCSCVISICPMLVLSGVLDHTIPTPIPTPSASRALLQIVLQVPSTLDESIHRVYDDNRCVRTWSNME